MNSAKLRNSIGQMDIATMDTTAALGRLDALKILIEGKVAASSVYLLDSIVRDVESIRFRHNVVRERLVSESALERIYEADHAGQDALDALDDRCRARAAGSGE